MVQKNDLTDKEHQKNKKATESSKKPGKKKETDNHEMDQLIERVVELETQLNELNDKYLRLFSEFDNYRKRTIKERVEMSKLASEEIITALLPVVDDLERAGSFDPSETSANSFAEGIGLIYSKLKILLTQKGVEPIEAIGEVFDTDYHEAITHIPTSDEGQKGKVVDQVQKGYSLNGKVIRFARVVVAN